MREESMSFVLANKQGRLWEGGFLGGSTPITDTYWTKGGPSHTLQIEMSVHLFVMSHYVSRHNAASNPVIFSTNLHSFFREGDFIFQEWIFLQDFHLIHSGTKLHQDAFIPSEEKNQFFKKMHSSSHFERNNPGKEKPWAERYLTD